LGITSAFCLGGKGTFGQGHLGHKTAHLDVMPRSGAIFCGVLSKIAVQGQGALSLFLSSRPFRHSRKRQKSQEASDRRCAGPRCGLSGGCGASPANPDWRIALPPPPPPPPPPRCPLARSPREATTRKQASCRPSTRRSMARSTRKVRRCWPSPRALGVRPLPGGRLHVSWGGASPPRRARARSFGFSPRVRSGANVGGASCLS